MFSIEKKRKPHPLRPATGAWLHLFRKSLSFRFLNKASQWNAINYTDVNITQVRDNGSGCQEFLTMQPLLIPSGLCQH